jgi:hypothetical protein
MTHFYKDLTGDFAKTVGAEKEAVIYWDQDKKFVGLRVDPAGKKTWVVHDWCAGCHDLGDLSTLKDFLAAYSAALKAIGDQLQELCDMVREDKALLPVWRDAIHAAVKVIGCTE